MTSHQRIVTIFPHTETNGLLLRLQYVFQAGLGGDLPTLAESAAQLGVSPRGLSRRLNRLGTSFQKEVNRFRFERALGYLVRDDISVTDIALQLGFCDSSAFSNAFKRWTGMSPRQYKRMHRRALR